MIRIKNKSQIELKKKLINNAETLIVILKKIAKTCNLTQEELNILYFYIMGEDNGDKNIKL